MTIGNSMRDQYAFGSAEPWGIGLGLFDVSGTVQLYFTQLSDYAAFVTRQTGLTLDLTIGSVEDFMDNIVMSNVDVWNPDISDPGATGDHMVTLNFMARYDATDDVGAGLDPQLRTGALIMKIQILANFHVFVPGDSVDDKRVEFTKGMVVDDANMPVGQSAQDWIEKGLAKAAEAASTGDAGAEAGPAVLTAADPRFSNHPLTVRRNTMSDYSFDDLDALQRQRDIEGKTGTRLDFPGIAGSSCWRPPTRTRNGWRDARSSPRAPGDSANAEANDGRYRAFIVPHIAEALCIGWGGWKNNGVEIEFSAEACKALLLKADDVYAAVSAVMFDDKKFRGDRIEVLTKEAGE